MSIDVTAGLSTPDVAPNQDVPFATWGTASRFRRLTQADPDTAAYWLATVNRVTHRTGHPKLNVVGCPGCTFEMAAVR